MSQWMMAFAAYLAAGLILVFVGPAARQRREQLKMETQAKAETPRWKLTAFSCAIALAIILFWPFLVILAARTERREPKTLWDVLQQNPVFREQKKLFEAMEHLCEVGVDADELPNGRGEFGMVPSNPIPCRTVFGSTAYLGRLRTSTGTKVVYRRVGSVVSDVSPHPVDVYEISHPDEGKLATLFISPYQKRISRRAPAGVTLAAPPSSDRLT